MISKHLKRVIIEKFKNRLLLKDARTEDTELTLKVYLLRMMEEFNSFSSKMTKIFVHTSEIEISVFKDHFKEILRYIIYGCEILNMDINDLLDEIKEEDSQK